MVLKSDLLLLQLHMSRLFILQNLIQRNLQSVSAMRSKELKGPKRKRLEKKKICAF